FATRSCTDAGSEPRLLPAAPGNVVVSTETPMPALGLAGATQSCDASLGRAGWLDTLFGDPQQLQRVAGMSLGLGGADAGGAGVVAGDPHPAAGAGELLRGAGESERSGQRHGPVRGAAHGAVRLHAARPLELRGVPGEPVRPRRRRPGPVGGAGGAVALLPRPRLVAGGPADDRATRGSRRAGVIHMARTLEAGRCGPLNCIGRTHTSSGPSRSAGTASPLPMGKSARPGGFRRRV